MNVTLILGNGFDLNMGLPTGKLPLARMAVPI